MRVLLADIVLVLHFGLALFIVLGLAAIWLGAFRNWRWVRNVRFRIAHIAAITVVALEGALGIACPLTLWEDRLRQSAGEPSFVARWVQRLLYYDLPEWVFAVAYIAMAVATAITWVYVRPGRNRDAP
ncbi:MAG: DUF2784 domain-containing protein [Betaproteobacteria bacterium]|nr:MAG: DUF2784 domain-containing protein [Betaproteobacteria bacterium]RPI48901.1 MAG: DUF2784 domain-containing protein [Betaproteobacteria bacterium]